MASTNFTTHYSIPTPLGTDLTTPMDYNQAAEAVDTALFGAVTDAANASQSAQEAITEVGSISDTVTDIQTDLTQEKAKIVSLQSRMTSAENEIDDVRADSSDMITAFNEPTATSTHAYAIGDYFIYNNTLYKATAAIAIGATIVPDTNCTTTNISSELIQINASLNDLIDNEDITVTTSSEGKLYATSYIKKRGNMVQIELNGLKNISTQVNNVVINGMGTSIRPSRNLNFSHEFLGESYRIAILTDGTLNIYPYGSVSEQNNQAIVINYLV